MANETMKAGFRSKGGEKNALYVNDRSVPAYAEFSPAAGGSNVSEVTVVWRDGEGNLVTGPMLFNLWLSDAATGVGLTGTSASGTVTAKAASGVVWDTQSAKKALTCQALGSGAFVLEITDTAKTGFYVCAQNPVTGEVHVSSQLVTANYG